VASGCTLGLIGSLVGSIGAVAARGVLSAQAYGVSPSDPLTIAITIVGLVVVAALASAVPAWRALRIDAARALRGE
jgi:putative ABC transport system permease protein